MCGIAGYIGFEALDSVDRERILSKMLTRISHRGPDESGLFLSPKANFGNVRLSIIDLASGQQPLCNEDGNLWIAYNGEVFNYIELRELLIKKGHKLRTHCDTEVVLHLYEEFGPSCLNMLNGQFAIAIWNIKKEELFLARDRVGIRPLFYSRHQNNLIFGSEIKSIFEFPGVERSISEHSLKQIFTFWTTITPDTVFKGIKELPPGHFGIYSKGEFKISQYWTLNFTGNKNTYKGTIEDAKNQLDSLFTDSIKLRMRADVPVAAYLSGGLDSSVTTSYIKKLFPTALNTFSIGFEDKDYDETGFQNEVADYFKTEHHTIKFYNSDVGDLLEKVIWHSEIPLLRAGPIPMFKLSKLVRDNNIKVVVTGEGADEALGGYNIFKEALIREFWSKFPDSKIRPLLLRKLYPYIPHLKDANSSVLRMFFGYQLSKTDSPAYSHLLRWKNSSNILNHLNPEIKDLINHYDPVQEYTNTLLEQLNGMSTLEKAQYIETNVFMSGYLLSSQGDRVAMGNSVEGRYPFLDYRILEFCATLPDKFKLNGLNEKYLIKYMMKGKLPESVIKRPKQAYRAPIASALLNKDVNVTKEMTDKGVIENIGLFNYSSVSKLLDKMFVSVHINEIDSMALMVILSTQLLYKQFISDFSYLKDTEVRKSAVRMKID